MDHGGLLSPVAEVGCVNSNGRCKKPEFSRKKHHQAVLQDNRDAVGPQKLPPSLGCDLGT